MDIYGDLTYNKGRAKYFGLPVEQTEKTLSALEKKYDETEAKWDELNTNIRTLDILDSEAKTIESELKLAHDNMGTIIETNNFHLGSHAIRTAVNTFQSSKNVKVAKEKKAEYVAFTKEIEELRKKYKPGEHGGLTDVDAEYLINLWKSKNANYTHVENGEIVNKVQGVDYAEQVDMKKYGLDYVKKLDASTFNENTRVYINGKSTTIKQTFGSMGDFYRAFDSKGVDDSRVLGVLQSVITDAPVLKRLNYEVERDINLQYGDRTKDGRFVITPKGTVKTTVPLAALHPDDITITDAGTIVSIRTPRIDNNGQIVYQRNEKGEIKLDEYNKPIIDYDTFAMQNLNDLSEEDKQEYLKTAAAFNLKEQKIKNLEHFIVQYSYKLDEAKYTENWRSRERYRDALEKREEIVKGTVQSTTNVKTYKLGGINGQNITTMNEMIEIFKKGNINPRDFPKYLNTNSTYGRAAGQLLTTIVNNQEVINEQKWVASNFTKADIAASFKASGYTPTQAQIEDKYNHLRTLTNGLLKYSKNSNLPIAPVQTVGGVQYLTAEWKAYCQNQGISFTNVDDVLTRYYNVPKSEQKNFVANSSELYNYRNLTTSRGRQTQTNLTWNNPTNDKPTNQAFKDASTQYFNNTANRTTVLVSNVNGINSGDVTSIENLISTFARNSKIPIDKFTQLPNNNSDEVQTYPLENGKFATIKTEIRTYNSKPYTTKTIRVITGDGNVEQSITYGTTIGTDSGSGIYHPSFDKVVKESTKQDIRSAITDKKNVYVWNERKKVFTPVIVFKQNQPYVVNQNGSSTNTYTTIEGNTSVEYKLVELVNEKEYIETFAKTIIDNDILYITQQQ